MREGRGLPSPLGTPELREAVRSRIVVQGLTASTEIAADLGMPHGTVVRMLRRFEAVGALALSVPEPWREAVEVVPGSLSARFRDLSARLW